MPTSQSRKLWTLFILFSVVAAAMVWWFLRPGKSSAPREELRVDVQGSQNTVAKPQSLLARVDPKTLKRGSISGKVFSDTGAPLLNASVCAEMTNADISQQLQRDPICTVTDAKGAFSLGELLQARYSLSAGAEGYGPQTYLPTPNDPANSKVIDFFLVAGQQRSDVNFVLSKDGVLLTGSVTDISGGAIVGATVRSEGSSFKSSEWTVAVTDEQGRYRLWVRSGEVSVSAVAEGYAEIAESGWAPGEVDLKLTPESGISGTVRDEQGAVVAGALVSDDQIWSGISDITDENGRFRITRLVPGSYKLSAHGDSSFGMAAESTVLGLAQFVDGVEIILRPASMVSGRVILPGGDKKSCDTGRVSLRDERMGIVTASADATGLIIFRGLRPGTYQVLPYCRGFRTKEKPPALVLVSGKNALDQQWLVEKLSGSLLTGTVTRKDGQPLEGVDVRLVATENGPAARRKSAADSTDRNGKYEFNGLEAGAYSVMISTRQAAKPKTPEVVEVIADKTLVKNFVLENGGAIRALVIDSENNPVKGVAVAVDKIGKEENSFFDFSRGGATETGSDGIMIVQGLSPGQYKTLVESRSGQQLRKAGTTDNDRQTELITIKDSETIDVKFVVESKRGEISGVVQTSTGEAITDAYVIAVRESDADGADSNSALQRAQWGWGDPVLVDSQGKFTVKKLAAGKYTLRGFRRGGGGAVLQHVAVGSNVVIVVKSGGSISGTVAGVDSTSEVSITVVDRKTKVQQSESFYGTLGAFVIRDLPAGEYEVTATVGSATGTVKVVLADNEAKAGVAIKTGQLVTVVGRLVDLHTGAPVADMQVSVEAVAGGRSGLYDSGGNRITDRKGKFRVEGIPTGKVSFASFSTFPRFAWHGAEILRTIPDTATGEYDFGDLPVVAKRTKPGQPVGEHGITFKEHSDRTETHPMEIARLEPGGPASKTELKVGDVITAIDSIDIRGERVYLGSDLLSAPPGTKVAITVERGVTVTIVLASPK